MKTIRFYQLDGEQKLDAISQMSRILYEYLLSNFGECRFSADELENAIELAIRRGTEGGQIIKEAINFLYS